MWTIYSLHVDERWNTDPLHFIEQVDQLLLHFIKWWTTYPLTLPIPNELFLYILEVGYNFKKLHKKVIE